MERIELSKTCKMILRAVKNGDYKKYEICYEDILVLIYHGLITGTEVSGRKFMNLQLTKKGIAYITWNKELKNPTIWEDKKFWIATAISIISVLISLVSLYISLSK